MNIADIGHAFITGGASGIGLGTAQALVARGTRVTIADVNREALDAAVEQAGDKLRGVVLDVRDREGWRKAKAEAEAAFGPVDLLFNNAGIASVGYELADMDPESFDRIVGINLHGVFNGISAFAADMRGRGFGHVVSTASVVGIAAPMPGVGGNYVASKFGVIGLSEVLRVEMLAHGVGVSVLCPGHIATGIGRSPASRGDSRAVPGMVSGPGGKVSDLVPELLAGIEANSFYILSHCQPEWPKVESRLTELRDAFAATGVDVN
jgi:NAD(P)-dependent dehydrogenase (short-subunit alcohol dehydrogenase family)